MLEFFRKYQRLFFIFISVVIIFSFVFFGTFSTFSQDEKREDRVIACSVGGSPLMQSEVHALSRFIATDREDSAGHGFLPNLCNDGVVRYDLLRTGLADLLAASYFDAIKEEFASRLERVKRYRPYAHPQIPLLSAEAVWDRFFPAMGKEFNLLKTEESATVGTFTRFSKLYQQQSYLTPETLRSILVYQHQHLGLGVDPRLQNGDLSLFGFHSLSDWFGRNFLTLASQFILNAAAVAEQKGYQVTLEEAKGDLLVHFQTSLQKRKTEASQLSFSQHLRNLGFDEKSAAETWRKVLLFRRYFQGVGQTAFVDHLPFKDFALYARETANLSVYQWPEALRLRDLEDLAELELYLSAVAPKLKDPLDLPSSFYSEETVEADYPELVQSSYRVKSKEIPLSQVALRAPVKEVWEWELEEKNWDALKSVFSFLPQGCSREERFQSLEKLHPSERAEIDAYARLQICEKHPEWKEDAILAVSSLEQTISISKATSTVTHVEKPWRLRALLEKAAEGEDGAKQELLSYSDDKKTLYRFEEVEKLRQPHILTFAEAKSQGILKRLVERSLSAHYPKLREKYRSKFESEKGSWKPFAEVKGEVAKIVYRNVFDAIEDLEERAWTESLYAGCRLLPATRKAYQSFRSNPNGCLASEGELRAQFQMERSDVPIQRTSQEEWMKEQAFVMMPNEWSPIRIPPNGDLSFFYLIDKRPCENPILDQISFGKELIAADAQRYLAEKLLESIFQNQSIVVPMEVDNESI